MEHLINHINSCFGGLKGLFIMGWAFVSPLYQVGQNCVR